MMDVREPVLEQARRGVRLQIVLRGALVAFLVLTLVLLPPVDHAVAFAVLIAIYAVATAVFAACSWRGGPTVARWGWLGLFVDLLVLSVLAFVADTQATTSWTSYVLIVGCFLLPVLAATQLSPGVCLAVVAPTVAVFLADAIITKSANDEPWASILLHTFLLASVAVAAVGLTRIQRARVASISALLDQRTQLLEELLQVDERERTQLAERLHDGALQYVLGARFDLDEVRSEAPDVADRVDLALTEAARLLRSTVAELHPAVLAHAGLAQAIAELTVSTARPGLHIELDSSGWPDGTRTPLDGLLFGAARELLSNVVKHADAGAVRVTLALADDAATLAVRDDGTGMPRQPPGPAAGHVGLHALRVRVEAAGGRLDVVGSTAGTSATVVVPVNPAVARAGDGNRTRVISLEG